MTIKNERFPHRQIAVSCFNNVWDLLDKPNRTPEEDEEMGHLAHSSFWHWTQVPDHSLENLSIGYWQLSRVYAVLGKGENALQYAKRCIDVSIQGELAPFYLGYAYEAMARALNTLSKLPEAHAAKEKAFSYAESVTHEESKSLLLSDLKDL